jgi:hypothetical protein
VPGGVYQNTLRLDCLPYIRIRVVLGNCSRGGTGEVTPTQGRVGGGGVVVGPLLSRGHLEGGWLANIHPSRRICVLISRERDELAAVCRHGASNRAITEGLVSGGAGTASTAVRTIGGKLVSTCLRAGSVPVEAGTAG